MCDVNNSVSLSQILTEEADLEDREIYLDVGAEYGYQNNHGVEYPTAEPKLVEREDAVLIVAENFHVLKSRVPDAKNSLLWDAAKNCLKQGDSAEQYAEDLINTNDYPLEDLYCENLPDCTDELDVELNAALKYSSLRSIFPEADTVWVWGVAKDYAGSSDDVLNKFVIHVQETGDYPRVNLDELPASVKIEVRKQQLTRNAQKILHNIDAEYIERQLNKDIPMGYNEQGVSQIILNCISDTQKCPSKAEEYYRHITEEAIEQYSNNFDVEKYLQRYPEPVKYFENPTQPPGPKYRADVFKYLRIVAANFSVDYIRETQKRLVYLIRIHRAIFGRTVPVKTINYKLTDECARFVHELTYVRFYERISALSASLVDTGNRFDTEESLHDFDTMPCELCEEPVPLRKILTCTEAHMFCEGCVRRWINECLANARYSVNCLQMCPGQIPDDVLSRVLPAGAFYQLIQKRQDHEVGNAQIDGIVNCLWCGYSYVPRSVDMDLVCLNPECGERWCKKCRELAHHPKPCEDSPAEVQKRVFIEERMTKAAVRSCPKCNADIEKDGGCDYVQCKCGTGLCFNCGQVAGHHTCNLPRATFNVYSAGQNAKAEAEIQFPGVKLNHDPTRLV